MNPRAIEECRDRIHRLGQSWGLAIATTAKEYRLTTREVAAGLRGKRRVTETEPTGKEWWNK
jgi:hypothetical protein